MTRQGDESAAGAAMNSADVPTPRITDAMRQRATTAVLRRLGTWTNADGVHATYESAEVLRALFCTTPKRPGKRPALLAVKAIQADPASSQHPPEDIGAFRSQVCEWGRANGWPEAYSRQPLDTNMLAAYRAAHAGEGS